MKNITLIIAMMVMITSCTEISKDIAQNENEKLSIEYKEASQKLYVSNIYKDKDLGEVFWEKSENEILQISNGKQNISSLLLDESNNNLIYAQSQSNKKPPKILERFIINGPSGFSKYKILTYNLNTGIQTELFDLSKEGIVGSVAFLDFLNNRNILAFQTNYGEIYFLEINKSNVVTKFKIDVDLPNQFEFDSFHNMKTDGKNFLFFDAVSGYKSNSDSSFVYNTYRYNINTKEIIRITKNEFYF